MANENQTPQSSGLLLSAKEVATILHLHPNTVLDKAKRREIVSYPIGGKVLFKRKDIDIYIEDRRREVDRQLFSSLSQAEEWEKSVRFQALTFISEKIKNLKGGHKKMGSARMKERLNLPYGGYFKRKLKKSDVWYIYWYDENGKRKFEAVRHATCPEEAFIALEFKRIDVFKKLYSLQNGIEIKKDCTFKEFSAEYIEKYVNTEKKNPQTDVSIINGHLVPFFGKKKMSEIRKLDVQEFKNHTESRVKPSTASLHLTILRAMLNRAKDWGYNIKENPVKGIKVKVAEAKRTPVTEEEFQKILDHAQEHIRNIVICMWNTGLRQKECRTLEWDTINLKERTLVITAENSKNGEEATIPINDDLYELLKDLKEKSNGSKYVFTYFGKQIKTSINAGFNSAVKRAGIRKEITPHYFRHTFGTRLIDTGASLTSTRDLLRHKSLEETNKYCHSIDEQRRKAVNLIGGKGKKCETDLKQI